MIPTSFIGLEHLATAVIVLDTAQRIHYLNPAAENLFEVSSNKMVGHTLRSAFPGAEDLCTALRQALAHDTSYTEHELLLTLAGRSPFAVSCTVTCLETG
ncbi:MAG: PAS domain-containing protein, partial [Burkholderiales bacterium]